MGNEINLNSRNRPTTAISLTKVIKADLGISRSHLTTNEFASLAAVQSATIRRSLCVRGAYWGIKPVKCPNGKLLWPISEIKRVLEGK